MKRSFLGILCCAVVALTFAISAGAAVAQTKTLKMQATWPASQTLYENFTYFADRVNKLSGER